MALPHPRQLARASYESLPRRAQAMVDGAPSPGDTIASRGGGHVSMFLYIFGD
jgi:hypothetical protein